MTAVTRHRRPARRGWPPDSWWPWALGALAVAAIVGLLAAVVEPRPRTVPTVVVENPGGRSVTVVVRAADERDASTLVLGQVPAGRTAVFHEVLDLGEEWMVMLSYGPVSAGELRAHRDDLRDGWTVPEAVTRHFDRRASRPANPPGG